MSYCRFSADDFTCDLYCFRSFDGYTIHVAGSRVVGDVPKITAPLISGRTEEFMEQVIAQMAFLDTAEREDIDLTFAGQSFYGLTLHEFKAKLLELRGIGYRFPAEVLEDVDEELADESEVRA